MGGLLEHRLFWVVYWYPERFMQKDKRAKQLLLGAYSAMNRQIARGTIEMYNRHEMLDVVKK